MAPETKYYRESDPGSGVNPLERGLQLAQRFARRARADHTRRSYDADWKHWAAWCGEADVPADAPSVEAVCAWLAWQAGAQHLRAATIMRRLCGLRWHLSERLGAANNPAMDSRVRTVIEGIKRELGLRTAGAAPLSAADVRAMAEAAGEGLRGLRDRAMVLVLFATALRRSELVDLDWRDVEFCDGGAVLTVRRGKTDQHGLGRRVGVGRGAVCCPVAALAALGEASDRRGAIFRSIDRWGHMGGRLGAGSVNAVLQRLAKAAEVCGAVTGHSGRRGFVTAACAAGLEEYAIMRQTGHRNRAMVDRYNMADVDFSATARVGL